MMGSMEDMHRSMRSMMARHQGDQSASESSDQSSRMGRGMMGGRMGSASESMDERRGRMGEELNMEEMRRLCRTMQATMQDIMHGEASSAAAGSVDEQVSENLDLKAQTEEWLGSTRGFETIEDRTGESEVVVKVGAGTGLSYAPAAVRVDPGTTIRWQWTGNGGLHNVAFVGTEVNTPLRGEQGETFTYTFTEPGKYRYECTPHAAVGMRGVVIVEAR
ncbi:MAG: halocyanin domain-containing protein [Salinibacter sp.]